MHMTHRPTVYSGSQCWLYT